MKCACDVLRNVHWVVFSKDGQSETVLETGVSRKDLISNLRAGRYQYPILCGRVQLSLCYYVGDYAVCITLFNSLSEVEDENYSYAMEEPIVIGSVQDDFDYVEGYHIAKLCAHKVGMDLSASKYIDNFNE